MKTVKLLVLAAFTFVLFFLPTVSLAAEFYKEKVVRIISGYPPGGGVDTEARLVARYIGKYIPGNPNVIVENMAGAGGRIALNHVSRVAKRDGLTWIVIPATPNIFQILDKDRKFDLTEMIYLRGSSEPGITVSRDITGVKGVADLPKADPSKLVIPGRISRQTVDRLDHTTTGAQGGTRRSWVSQTGRRERIASRSTWRSRTWATTR